MDPKGGQHHTRRARSGAVDAEPLQRTTSPSEQPIIPLIPLLRVTKQESLDSHLDRRSAFYKAQAWQHAQEHPPPKSQSILTIPTILSIIRLALVPVLGVLWYSPWAGAALWCALLFVAASITDWLDGYLARKFDFTTAFGAFIDPVADKVMVSTALILMATRPPAPLSQEAAAAPVVIMICREITMSALREWAAAAGGNAHKAVKVNSLGKWKTALQMSSMSVLLLCRDGITVPTALASIGLTVPGVVFVSWTFLWASAVLAVWSLAIYFVNVWSHFVNPTTDKSQ